MARTLVIPAYFKSALKQNPKAGAAFAGYSDSHKKEYLKWVAEAKKAETRRRRLEQALVMMAEGKSRNRTHE
jgi:uncharacterized protein YdeI (YjbR/CyaY-like superfamily)